MAAAVATASRGPEESAELLGGGGGVLVTGTEGEGLVAGLGASLAGEGAASGSGTTSGAGTGEAALGGGDRW